MNISYTVETRSKHAHAVIRTGPKGGVRLVEVYDNRTTADYIAGLLSAAIPRTAKRVTASNRSRHLSDD